MSNNSTFSINLDLPIYIIIQVLKPSLPFPFKSFLSTLYSSHCLNCGNVPKLDNGNAVLKVDGLSSYSAESVTCEKGYNVTSETIQCLDTGKWDNTSCEIVGQYTCNMVSCVKWLIMLK
jgi:hypothetical protein